jgi:hypothetical protein
MEPHSLLIRGHRNNVLRTKSAKEYENRGEKTLEKRRNSSEDLIFMGKRYSADEERLHKLRMENERLKSKILEKIEDNF